MKSLKTFGIAGSLIAAALVGGTLISAASAAPASSAASGAGLATDTDKGAAYCTTWKTTFADKLGVSADALMPAAKAASIAAIDAAVAAGDLTAERAAEIKAKINEAEGNGCHLLGGWLHRFAKHERTMDRGHDLIAAAAGALGMTPEQVFTALKNGDSLKEIASNHHVSYDAVVTAIVAAAKSHLDAAVTSGKLTRARADEMLSHLQQALADGTFPRAFGPRPDAPLDAPAS